MDLPPILFLDVDLNINHVNIIPPTEPIDQIEELRTYHSQIDKLSNPDPVNPMWKPDTIVSNHVLITTKQMHLKIQYPQFFFIIYG